MTSLQLFRQEEQQQKVPDEWGTGKEKGDINIWVPRTPTWHQSDVPIKQFYDLTELKRSNLRDNDQLLPRPEASNMGSMLINKSFPAENPYDSHISKFAVFPNFISPQDPNRGVSAMTRQPINAETPANSYDVKVIHKTKGSGIRQEVLTLVPESQKKPLVWNGEDYYDQVVKTHGNRQTFYPLPPKSIAPNPQQRPIEHQVSERTADTMRNVERSHWLTSNQLDYTGMGPSNSIKLDNIDDRKSHFSNTSEVDERLYPHFTNTFDPPRPAEGRIARLNLIPRKPQQPSGNRLSYDRKMSEHEKEEHRLFNGTAYINLPDASKDPYSDTRWQEIDHTSNTENMMEKLKNAADGRAPQEVPFPPTGPPPEKEPGYLEISKMARDERIQEMEAQNRFKTLEAQSPRNSLNALHYKYDKVNTKENPKTFYDHEGKYNEERAGMYKTSFDPHTLSYSINSNDISGAALTDTSRSHEDALYLPTSLSRDNNVLLKRSNTFCGNSQSMLGDKQVPREVMTPYHILRQHQKDQLLPLSLTASPLVQEREFVLKESTMGDSYNTTKFLQDNETIPFSRNEPLNLISDENQNLSRIRSKSLPRTSKSVQFSDKVMVAHVNPEEPVYVGSTALRGLTDDEKTVLSGLKPSVLNTTHQAGWKTENESDLTQFTGYQPSFISTNAAVPKISNPGRVNMVNSHNLEAPRRTKYDSEVVKREVKQNSIQPDSSGLFLLRQQPANSSSEYRNEFHTGSSTSITPSDLRRSSSFRSSYQSQYPIYHDLTFKSDPQFGWTPGSGTPRPQTSLLQMQDSFSKSDIKNKFNGEFPENSPEIRDHIFQGKKHVFSGVHGQLIHG